MTLLLIALLILAIIGLPVWRPSENRALYGGYYPSGGLGLVVLIVLVLALTGHIHL